MKLQQNNLWIVLSLLFTTIIGPVVVWNLQQGKIENLKIEIEKEKLQIEKNDKTVQMYEKLSKLLSDQRQNYDKYTDLVHKGHAAGGSFDLQRVRLQMEEKDQEIETVKKIIADMTGEKLEHIKGHLPPLPPSGFKVMGK